MASRARATRRGRQRKIAADPDPDKAFTAVHLPKQSIFVTRDGVRTWGCYAHRVAVERRRRTQLQLHHRAGDRGGGWPADCLRRYGRLRVALQPGRRRKLASTQRNRLRGRRRRTRAKTSLILPPIPLHRPRSTWGRPTTLTIDVSRDGGSTWQTAEPGTAGAINVIKADPNVPGSGLSHGGLRRLLA